MKHIWSDDETIANLSHVKFGMELARRVATKLKTQCISSGLFYSHRDYCGHGLIYRDGQFILVEVYDGFPDQSKILATWIRRKSLFSFSQVCPISRAVVLTPRLSCFIRMIRFR